MLSPRHLDIRITYLPLPSRKPIRIHRAAIHRLIGVTSIHWFDYLSRKLELSLFISFSIPSHFSPTISLGVFPVSFIRFNRSIAIIIILITSQFIKHFKKVIGNVFAVPIEICGIAFRNVLSFLGLCIYTQLHGLVFKIIII